MNKQSPREFFIQVKSRDEVDPNVWWALIDESGQGRGLHVIEYSAFEELTAERDRYKEALKFYANENSWMTTRKDHLHEARMTIIGDPRSFGQVDGTLLVVGGKRASEALEE